MAQFEPESLALSLRNHWHSLIRNSHPVTVTLLHPSGGVVPDAEEKSSLSMYVCENAAVEARIKKETIKNLLTKSKYELIQTITIKC